MLNSKCLTLRSSVPVAIVTQKLYLHIYNVQSLNIQSHYVMYQWKHFVLMHDPTFQTWMTTTPHFFYLVILFEICYYYGWMAWICY